MSEPLLYEIKIMSFGYAPAGWVMCNGQLLQINEYQELFSLLGTTYGGDGRVNFALPNLQARTPIHFGNGHALGEIGGKQAHTLTISEIPTHTHAANAANEAATSNAPSNTRIISQSAGANLYAAASNPKTMAPAAIANVGGSQPHQNMQPFLTLTFCISPQGMLTSDPYIGEIRMFAGNFAPFGWMLCDGQLLPIAENKALHNLIGTTYGGDGISTFALPDLRGRLPIHQGSGFSIAQKGGSEQVTLTTSQMPAHTHAFLASANQASSTTPGNQLPAITQASTIKPYGTDASQVQLSSSAVGSVGGQPHDNFQPYLCINFIICLHGVFPTQR